MGRHLVAPAVLSASCPQAKGTVHRDVTGAYEPPEHTYLKYLGTWAGYHGSTLAFELEAKRGVRNTTGDEPCSSSPRQKLGSPGGQTLLCAQGMHQI